jgi:hypothetical protein
MAETVFHTAEDNEVVLLSYSLLDRFWEPGRIAQSIGRSKRYAQDTQQIECLEERSFSAAGAGVDDEGCALHLNPWLRLAREE